MTVDEVNNTQLKPTIVNNNQKKWIKFSGSNWTSCLGQPHSSFESNCECISISKHWYDFWKTLNESMHGSINEIWEKVKKLE